MVEAGETKQNDGEGETRKGETMEGWGDGGGGGGGGGCVVRVVVQTSWDGFHGC